MIMSYKSMNAGCMHKKAWLIVMFQLSRAFKREREQAIERHDRPFLDTTCVTKNTGAWLKLHADTTLDLYLAPCIFILEQVSKTFLCCCTKHLFHMCTTASTCHHSWWILMLMYQLFFAATSTQTWKIMSHSSNTWKIHTISNAYQMLISQQHWEEQPLIWHFQGTLHLKHSPWFHTFPIIVLSLTE